MMILEHGDMGCGIAMLFHMPTRGQDMTKPHNGYAYPQESIEQYKERFLTTTLKQRRMFRDHQNSTMGSDRFSSNGTMKDGTAILHLRTVKEWLTEYPRRTMTLITLGQTQQNSGLGDVLVACGFTKKEEAPNPIMGFAPIFLYTYPAVGKSEAEKLEKSWSEKLKKEEAAMIAMGMATDAKDVKRSTFMHGNFNV